MQKLFTLLGVLMFSIGMTACNTMQGVGEDVERGGEKVQETARDVQNGPK
jgi:entericidin B